MTKPIRTLFAMAAMLVAQVAGASVIHFSGFLSGANEAPANASPGVGTVAVDVDTVLGRMTIDTTFGGLVGTTTGSHIHCCTALAALGTAGVATTTPSFAGFPVGVTAGTYSTVLDLTSPSSYNAAFITGSGGTTAGAESALIAGMLAGSAYFDIHTTAFPAGEIRSFPVPTAVATPVPEPGIAGLVAIGLVATLAGRRRSRR